LNIDKQDPLIFKSSNFKFSNYTLRHTIPALDVNPGFPAKNFSTFELQNPAHEKYALAFFTVRLVFIEQLYPKHIAETKVRLAGYKGGQGL
jgi:hypothetical protein